ncbi:MAG: NRDE family protein [Saprospiraceae bacterium]
MYGNISSRTRRLLAYLNGDETFITELGVGRSATRSGGLALSPRYWEAGGTWICTGSNGRLVCLLNGAFEHHAHRPPYRRSRGLVVLDVFLFSMVTDFLSEYDLTGIEPFTMIIAEPDALWELRWDENSQRHVASLARNLPHIWSSATLYSEEYGSEEQCCSIDGNRKNTLLNKTIF